MNLGIVIATYNRINNLNTLLNQIDEQELDDTVKIKIIIIDDNSPDGTAEYLMDTRPDIIYIHGDGNWWWTRCMNEGFKKAIELGLDYILILNDDTEIKKNFICQLLQDYKSLPELSILGSSILSISTPHLIEFAGTKEFIRWRLKAKLYLPPFTPLFKDFKGIHPTCTLNGRGTIIPVKILKTIGLFDEKLIQYGSDDEFVWRARKFGIGVFISWNSYIYNNYLLTSDGTAFKQQNISIFLKSFFNKYSVNSLKKEAYLYYKYGYKIFLPFFLFYFVLGTFKAYFIKYRHLKIR